MNIIKETKMKVIEYCEKNDINYCPIKLVINEEERDKELKDEAWINKPNPIEWWVVHKDKINKRKALMKNEEIKCYNAIIMDTRNIIQLDIDIDTQEDFDKLSAMEQTFYNKLCNTFDSHKSNTKEYGKHIMICDINDSNLSKLQVKYFKEHRGKLGELSDYSKYKLNKKDYKYLKDEYGWIEILCGRNSWVGIDAEINITEGKGKNFKREKNKEGFEILKTILQDKYFKKKEVVSEKKKKSIKLNPKKTQEKIEELAPSEKENNNIQELKEHLLNISQKTIDSYLDFYKIAGAVSYTKNTELYETLKDIASKSKHKQSNFNSWFDNFMKKLENKKFHKGIIFNYSKTDNIKTFFEIHHKYNYSLWIKDTPKQLAELFFQINEENIIAKEGDDKSKSIIYCYNDLEKLWRNQSIDNDPVIRDMISDDIEVYGKNVITKIFDSITEINSKIKNGNISEEEKDQLKEDLKTRGEQLEKAQLIVKNIQHPTLINNIMIMLYTKLKRVHLRKMEFDANRYDLPFKNKVKLNLKTNELSAISREDYIETMIDYDYETPTSEDYKLFVKIFEGCFMDEEYEDEELEKEHRHILNDVVYVLATGLFGKQIQSVFIFNGAGGNGKSMIMNIYKNVLSRFVMEAQGSQLCDDIKVSKPAPEWADLKNKRTCIFDEIPEDRAISINTAKILSGNSTIKARNLFANTETIKILITLIVLCNSKPKLQGEINDAITRRFYDIEWRYKFKAPNSAAAKEHLGEEDSEGNWTYKKQNGRFKLGNTDYECSHFQDRMKIPMLKYLLDWIKDYPDKISKDGNEFLKENYEFSRTTINRTKLYMSSQNMFEEIMEDMLIDTKDEKNVVLLSGGSINLYEKYREAERTMGTKLNDCITMKKFKEQLLNHHKYSSRLGELSNTIFGGVKGDKYGDRYLVKKGNYLTGFYYRDIYEKKEEDYKKLNIPIEEEQQENNISNLNLHSESESECESECESVMYSDSE